LKEVGTNINRLSEQQR